MSRGRAVAIIAAEIAFSLAAVVAVLVAPERFAWIISITAFGPDGGGVHEIIVPLGYWAMVAVYAGVARAAGGSTRAGVPMAIAIGVILHLTLALAAFAPELAQPTHFTTGLYWRYSRIFCAGALAAATGWIVDRVARSSSRLSVATDLATLPMTAGAIVLCGAMARHDIVAAIAGLVAGIAVGLWTASAGRRGGVIAALPARVRAVMVDKRVFLLLVCLLALALRLLFLYRIMHNPAQPDYIETGIDGRTYDRLAWSLAQGHGVPEEFRIKFPLILLGYVRWLAAIYMVAGHSYVAVCGVQAVLGALTCLLAYTIGRPLFGTGVALVTSLLAALNYQLIFAAAAIGHQGLDLFLTALTAWLLIVYLRSPRPGWAAALGIGLLAGCAIAVRETSACFWAFALVWLPFALADQRARARVIATAALTAGILLVLVPVMAPLVDSAHGRQSLREHLDRLFYDQAVNTRNDLVAPFANPQAALEQLRAQPSFVASRMGSSFVRNFAVQFLTQPYGGFDVVFLATNSSYYYALWFYVYALGSTGIIIAARRALSDARAPAAALVLLLGVLATRTLPHLLLESHYRHRAPLEVFLIMIAVAGAASLFAAARRAEVA